jgi:hypothetical protein
MKALITKFATAAALLTLPMAAWADELADRTDKTPDTLGEGRKSEDLPAPKSYNEAPPPVAAPAMPPGGIVKQAGVGGVTAYGRAGVLELGGSAFVTKATDLTQVNFSPSVGWFFMDNLEISAILGVNYSRVAGIGRTYVNALVEPSFHIPFSDQAFGFLGLGVGMAFAQGPGTGFALAPRVGANIMVGRSGILTPALNVAYTTHDVQTAPNGALLGVSVSYGLGLGYTVMW